MRLFAAAVPGGGLLAALVQAQEDLRRLGGRGNFSARENLHLTLAFLGETDRPDGARRALSRLTGSPLALWAEGLGRFRRPEGDLCWAGIRPSPPLEAVVRLDEAMKAAEVTLAALFEPPSETNFGGGLLTGTQSACKSACEAFAQAVLDIAQRPREV